MLEAELLDSDEDLDREVSALTARSDESEPKSGSSVVIIAGEASESEEEELNLSTNKSTSESETLPKTRKILVEEFTSEEIVDLNQPQREEAPKYKSLLHKKLRTRNISLQNNLTSLVNRPFNSATNEIYTITHQLIKTQMLVQDLSPLLRQQTNDLFYLEDKIDFIRDCSNIIPDIKLKDNNL